MSGVHTGTRLDQLIVLRDQVAAEIQRVRRSEFYNGRGVHPAPTSAEALMRTLGVTPLQVKTWAVEQCLIPAVRSGRVSLTLVNAFQAAHDGRCPTCHQKEPHTP